jgi:amino acid transporter
VERRAEVRAGLNAMAGGKISLAQSALIGVGGNAPSYSIAVTSGALLGAVAGLAPMIIFLCGWVVLGILLAYKKLNAEQASAGAAYTWVSHIINPTLGFFAGWCVLVASLLFIVAASLPAGKAALMIVDPALAGNKWLVTLVALVLLAAVSFAVLRGIEVVGRVQTLLTGLELALIVIIAATIIIKFGGEVFHARHLSALTLDKIDAKTFSAGVVIAIFFYWGWDVIFNVAEETHNGKTTSGRAGLIVLLALIAIFTFFAAAVASVISADDIKASGDNAIFAIAAKVFPKPFDAIAVLTFLLSTIGAMEASLLQFSRTVLAKSRDGRMSARLAYLHPRWRTPVRAVLLDVAIVTVLLLGSLFFGTVEEAIAAGIGATGILVAYYYGFAGIACAVYFARRDGLTLGGRLLYVVWPLASVAVLFAAGVLATLEFNRLATASVVVSLLIGVVVFALNRPR